MKRYAIHVMNDKTGDRTFWEDTEDMARNAARFFRMNKNNTVIVKEIVYTGNPHYPVDSTATGF